MQTNEKTVKEKTNYQNEGHLYTLRIIKKLKQHETFCKYAYKR